jgi:enamine deaminase RidA (YjgF/YER057c/UK114 family)
MDVVVVESGTVSELHLTLTPRQGETPAVMAGRLAGVLGEWNATMVRQIVFGSNAAYQPTLQALKQILKRTEVPLTWVGGGSCLGPLIAGMQVHAVTGANVRSVKTGFGSVACTWEDAVARHCVLNALGPTRLATDRQHQARETFTNLQAGLAFVGMSMKDLARTWFYLEDILAWYGDFNHERNDFFARCELRLGSAPASTGVSGRNPSGSALTGVAWAVRPHDGSAKAFRVVPSPRQCPAPSYGSAFSRAVEIRSAGFRQLLVSGTASIAPDGRTEHIGDAKGQIELSMQVVKDILESRAMSFADVSRATAYFASSAGVAAWDDWRARHGLQAMPVVCTCCDICRGDLLFEIELDAIQSADKAFG